MAPAGGTAAEAYDPGVLALWPECLVETVQPCRVGEQRVPPGVVFLVSEVKHDSNVVTVEPFQPGRGEVKLMGGRLDAFDDTGKPNVAQLSAQAYFVAHQFIDGSSCDTLSTLRVRESEALDSAEVGILKPWTPIMILEHGQQNDRRARIEAESVNITGWVSLVTTAGAASVQIRAQGAKPKPIGVRFGRSKTTEGMLQSALAGDTTSAQSFQSRVKEHSRCCEFAPNVSYHDVHGKNALFFAAAMGHASILEHLFAIKQKEIPINFIDEAKRSALHWAASSSQGDSDRAKMQAECARMLVLNKCNMDHQDFRGRTPLMVAIYSGNADVCKQLLGLKACLSIKDRAHMTAFQYAAISGNPQFVDLLQSHTPRKTPGKVKDAVEKSTTEAPEGAGGGPDAVAAMQAHGSHSAPKSGAFLTAPAPASKDTPSQKIRHVKTDGGGKKERRKKDSSQQEKGAVSKDKTRRSPAEPPTPTMSQRAPKSMDF